MPSFIQGIINHICMCQKKKLMSNLLLTFNVVCVKSKCNILYIDDFGTQSLFNNGFEIIYE